jgi:hypothetical protein
MTETNASTGCVRRRCEQCGVEVEVQRPTRILGKDSSRSQRDAYRKEIQRQILWEALCPACRGWWNARLRQVQTQPTGSSS